NLGSSDAQEIVRLTNQLLTVDFCDGHWRRLRQGNHLDVRSRRQGGQDRHILHGRGNDVAFLGKGGLNYFARATEKDNNGAQEARQNEFRIHETYGRTWNRQNNSSS